MIEVYTDGSCLGNPGTGGWAFRIINESTIINHFGYQLDTTNNQMELTAAIKALEFLQKKVKLYYLLIVPMLGMVLHLG